MGEEDEMADQEESSPLTATTTTSTALEIENDERRSEQQQEEASNNLSNRPSSPFERLRVGFVVPCLLFVVVHFSLPTPPPPQQEGELLSSSTADPMNNSKPFDWNVSAARLCPKMVPLTDLGPKLFALARQELGNSSCPASHSLAHDVLMSHVFYQWYWGDQTYQTSVGNRFSYIPIWKCANNGLENFCDNKQNTFQRQKNIHLSQNPDINCVVAAVRDPISHFLSGYNEVEYRLELYRAYRQGVAKTWNFAKIPRTEVQQRFRQFLMDFLSCPFERRYKGIFSDYEHYSATLELSHLYSMTGVLAHLASHSSVNVQQEFHYLPTFANLSTDWGPFVAKSCPNVFDKEQTVYLNNALVNPNKHKSSARESYSVIRTTWQNDQPLAKALCAIHLLDYACWKDLPEGVPTICLDLYASYEAQGLLQ